MKKHLFWLVVVLFAVSANADARKTFIFDAASPWVDSGFDYVSGSPVFIYATGAHADNPATDNWVHDPGGTNRMTSASSNDPLAGVPENGLIVRVGVGGQPFFGGTGGEFTFSGSGRLQFQVNDGGLSNNVGSILVHVLAQPTATILLPADQTWLDTGYDYGSGLTVFYLPIGFHSDNPASENWIHATSGSSRIAKINEPLLGFPENGLIGRIGAAGDAFYIGGGGPITRPGTGRLFIRINDGGLSNNVGHVLLYLFEESDGGVLTYCTSKTASTGCVPFMSFSGTPSPTSTTPFDVASEDAVRFQGGLLLYGTNKANFGFHGGKLCVKAPHRTAGKIAKDAHPVACTGGPDVLGRLATDFNVRIQSGADPLLTGGQLVFAQWFQRDPSNTIAGFSDNLSNGVRFMIQP